MNNIKQIREQFDLITEKEEKEDRKLSALVRAGLYDAKKLPALKRALDKSADKITSQEKRMLVNLLDSLISQVVSDDQVYRKVRQNVHNVSEAKMDTYSKFDPRYKAGWPTDKEMPSVLILKRKAIRVYPDNQKVALYYSQALDKYVTIPYNDIQTSLNEAKTDDEKKKKKKYFIKPKSKKDKDLPKPGGVKDTKDLINNRGQYAGSGIKRTISLATNHGLNIGGIIGTKMHDQKRKERALNTIARVRASKTQSVTEGKLDGVISLAKAGKNLLAKATTKTVAKNAAKGTAKKPGKGLRAPSKLDRLMRKGTRAGTLTGGAGALAGALAGSGGSLQASDVPKSPNYNFTAKTSTSSSFANKASSTATQDRNDQKLARKSQQAMTNESNVLDAIKSIVENDIQEQKIQFNENEITINNTVAKKLLTVYESINKTNKKKMEQMLNESASSFNKVLMFAVRQ